MRRVEKEIKKAQREKINEHNKTTHRNKGSIIYRKCNAFVIQGKI